MYVKTQCLRLFRLIPIVYFRIQCTFMYILHVVFMVVLIITYSTYTMYMHMLYVHMFAGDGHYSS